MEVIFRNAEEGDAAELAKLVNTAYRPAADQGGWTHEADLIVGQRISEAQVKKLIAQDSVILLMQRKDRIVACVHVQYTEGNCYVKRGVKVSHVAGLYAAEF